MKRRTFVSGMGLVALTEGVSQLASSRLLSSMRSENGNQGESPAGFPISGRLTPSGITQSELPKSFVNPPESAAPWVYWMWINVDTSPAAMTFDLEQMKARGIPGFILYNSPPGGVPRDIPRMVLVDEDHHFEYQFVKDGEYTDCYTTPIPFPPLEAWTPLWRERIHRGGD